MYPVIEEYTEEILDNLLVGMQNVIKRNPDSGFSIHRLIGRAVTDLIIMSGDTKELAIICEVMVNDFGKKYLFIWGSYATIKYDMDKVFESLKWAAGQTGCEYIEAASHRCGWTRKMERFDVEVLPMTTYRKYL